MNFFLATETNFEDAPQGLLALQSIYDLVPVILFLLGSILLLRTLYSKMVKGNYVLLGAGSIMVFVAGFLKALHKFLMAVARIDYVILDRQFTSTQSVGFALLAIALVGMFTKYNQDHIEHPTKDVKAEVVLLPLLSFLPLFLAEGEENKISEFTSTMPFIILMILGASVFLIMLMVLAIKMHRVVEIILFALSLVFMVGMGYLSTKHYFEGAWMQISCNLCYQLCFFLGCLLLKKHGLGDFDLRSPKKAK